jgi:hypothetical protein
MDPTRLSTVVSEMNDGEGDAPRAVRNGREFIPYARVGKFDLVALNAQIMADRAAREAAGLPARSGHHKTKTSLW